MVLIGKIIVTILNKVFVSIPTEQPPVLDNVYRLHYSFFKGQNILLVSFSFDVIIYQKTQFMIYALSGHEHIEKRSDR